MDNKPITSEVIDIISRSRNNAYRKVNEELILMYWKIGEYLHRQSKNAYFGDTFIDSIVESVQNEFPGSKDSPAEDYTG